MKLVGFQFAILFALFMIIICMGCTDTDEFANPLDPENLRTSGSPTGLETIAGDQQVGLTWTDLGVEGIAKYRIYRRFTGDSSSTFEFVGEVDAPAAEFTDTKDIRNDQFDFSKGVPHEYIYRISYVDLNNVEVPDPNSPPGENEDPKRIWPTSGVTPSVPPPPPNVVVGDQVEDLTVKLIWDDYQFPDDFELFRVFAAVARPDGTPLDSRLVAELTREEDFYFDRDFRQDNVTKVYRIVAVDRFGVEGVTTVQATSPSLPPTPPQNVRLRIAFRSLFNDRYDATISWTPHRARDLDGYQIYSTKEGGEIIPRNTVPVGDSIVTITGEKPILVGQDLILRQYFITAFDDTLNAAGARDESEVIEALVR